MAESQSKNGKKTADGRFATGNDYGTGRPKGSRNKATLALDALLAGEAEAIVRILIDAAKNGGITAARVLLDRVVPPQRHRAITLSHYTTESTLTAQAEGIFQTLADGEITPQEGELLFRSLMLKAKINEQDELEQRISALEKSLEPKS